ncbi:amino acid adenylation domain-containing protein [Bacillus subtilis]|uniref:Amino acid adenylation domain-containing protein n=1 Tax=Bacillus subtilis TaxID=1423 RepID=A0A8I2BB89_BACIU|nr:amino acid adenylation domain-containing protein [Bacillus subtilis]
MKIKTINILDNLFELGASSLELLLITSKIQSEFNTVINISEMFEIKVLKDLAEYIKIKPKNMYSPIKPLTKQKYYSTSSSQKRLYALDKLGVDKTYNVTTALIIEGNLDINKLEMSFRKVIKRHEPLRTSYKIIDGELRQTVHEQFPFEIIYEENFTDNYTYIVDKSTKLFDLDKVPLMRVNIIKTAKNKYLLVMDTHHIAVDGLSVNILLEETISLYSNIRMLEKPIQYKDFVEWNNKILDKEEKELKHFWTSSFAKDIPKLNFHTDYPRPLVQSFKGDKYIFTLKEDSLIKLKKIALKSGTTLFMILLSSYYVLLSKYTSQDDIIVGTLMNGRLHPDVNDLVGMFANTLPLRNFPESSKTLGLFLEEVKISTLNAIKNQSYPLESIIEKCGVNRDLSRNPLFDTVFILQEHPKLSQIEDFKMNKYHYHNHTSRVDLTLEAYEINNQLHLEFEFCTELFNLETIKRLSVHYHNLLENIEDNLGKQISEINIMTGKEMEKELYSFNSLKDKNLISSSLSSLPSALKQFEVQANFMNKTALVFENDKLSYTDLNKKTNQMARQLQKHGVKAGVRVGIMSANSFELIIGMLSVMKAGGTFLLIDPEYPVERRKYMLRDSEVKLLLVKDRNIEDLNELNDLNLLCISDSAHYTGDTSNLNYEQDKEDIAYIMYTSGSTGKPKGVKIKHKSLNCFIKDFTDRVKFDQSSSILSMTSVSFDPFIVETLVPLTKGMRIVIAKENLHRNSKDFNETLKANNVDILQTTPSRMKLLLSNPHKSFLNKIKSLIIGGEPFSHELLKVLKKVTSSRIYNVYGPTETTIWSAVKELTSSKKITIGKPLENMAYFILDKNLKPLPLGVEGEICISGSGMAEGYLNNEELNNERFISNPYFPSELMYRTGDYGRRLSNGEIEITGRYDDQVKIRGYRIELKEIQNQLLMHDLVNEATVVSLETKTGDKNIYAYYSSNESLDLRRFLSNRLPQYMIPAQFIQLESMPLNINGKVDKTKLPLPIQLSNEEPSLRPTNSSTEKKIELVWKEILKLEDIGVNQSFFELGGHSLNGTFVIARLNEIFGIELELTDLFKHSTIDNLANYIDQNKNKEQDKFPKITKSLDKKYYNLSSAQKRMFTIDQLIDKKTTYNVPQAIVINGKLDDKRLESALCKLIERHSILRTSIQVNDVGEPKQLIHPSIEFKLERMDLKNKDIDHVINDFVTPFNLMEAPLFRAKLVFINKNKFLLLFDMHHIIVDAASIMIFLSDLFELYYGNKLLEHTVEYKDYCEWETKIYNTNKIKRQEKYWINQFKDGVQKLDLPIDFPRPSLQSFEGERFFFSIDQDKTKILKKIAVETDSTLYIVLLTLYKIMLSIYSGNKDVIVGSPISGRNHAGLENVMGMFANTVAIKSELKTKKSIRELIGTVKGNVLEAFENQDYPFDKLVDKLGTDRSLGRNPVFDTMFVLQTVNFSELNKKDLKVDYYNFNHKISHFDILFQAYEDRGILNFTVEYSTALFKEKTIQKMVKYFLSIIDTVNNELNIKMCEIDILTSEEKVLILNQFNETEEYDF